MSDEKEIIETLENLAVDKYIDERKLEEKDVEAIINIIVLYKQEKEKNKELENTLKCTQNSWYEDTKVIEKQSKEIEELKNGQIDFWISDKEIEERIRNKFVNKDKIKAKIEEIERLSNNITMQPQIYPYIIEVLQSLLEKE